MEIEMAIQGNGNKNQAAMQPLNASYNEQKYRWVVIALSGLSLFVCGLINNAIAPLQHKMTVIYGVSSIKVTISVVLSFVVFFLVNFPANLIMEKKGIRVSSLIGTSLYFFGALCYVFINKSYYFAILGTLFAGIGQPFLINSPSKVAAFWFYPQNRTLATSVMIGVNILGLGFGFLIPTLTVSQESSDQDAKSQINHLYLGYLILAGICVLLNILFMRSKPQSPPSGSANAQKLSSIVQTLKQVKKRRNLWKFFPAYCMGNGTIIAFSSSSNFIMKPYGYTDIQIAINGVLLMVVGTVGSIVFSLYIKRTFNYKRVLMVISFGSCIMLLVLCFWLTTANVKPVTAIIMAIMGFIVTPSAPICFDLGCQLSFPIGEAQVTGLLNAGCLLWAFLSSAFVTSVFGYGDTKSSFWIIMVLSIFTLLSAILFFFVKIDLKRQEFQRKHKEQVQLKTRPSKQSETVDNEVKTQPQSPLTNKSEFQAKNYQYLVQEQQAPQNKENR